MNAAGPKIGSNPVHLKPGTTVTMVRYENTREGWQAVSVVGRFVRRQIPAPGDSRSGWQISREGHVQFYDDDTWLVATD